MSDSLVHRPRRLRRTAILRSLVRETRISPSNLIYPLFVCSGEGVRREVRSMPGVFNFSTDELVKEADRAVRLGINAVIVFAVPDDKDEIGSEAFAENGLAQRAISALKREIKDVIVIADTCLCEYTSHGHCGPIEGGEVSNDRTLELLQTTAISQARAGADVIAPSGMMDGMVGAIRSGLDASGYQDTPILSYAIKYASSYYGPFREAAGSAPQFGDRRGYQMDPANVREAMREADLDVDQGADMLMVKPALPFLDVIRATRERYTLPLAAYQVSGEYAQIKAAGQLGWIDEDRAVAESLISIKRAGADMILTYFATDAVRLFD